MYHSFEDLEVWKRSCRIAVDMYMKLKDCKDFSLRDQMQRSAVSIASNIAEGSERTEKEFTRFLSIARGSAAELRTQIFIAKEVGVLSNDDAHIFTNELIQISKMLFKLSKSLNISV
jgi:four helix bundle protein